MTVLTHTTDPFGLEVRRRRRHGTTAAKKGGHVTLGRYDPHAGHAP
jgi:hypothetical protein